MLMSNIGGLAGVCAMEPPGPSLAPRRRREIVKHGYLQRQCRTSYPPIPRTDHWAACGCTMQTFKVSFMYECIGGKPPFYQDEYTVEVTPDDTIGELKQKIRQRLCTIECDPAPT